jgi:methionyl-tRNA formyltransferase
MRNGTNSRYLVLGSRPWNRTVFEDTIANYPGDWHFIGDRDALTLESVNSIAPRYLFFLHWSWLVPEALTRGFECVCFHMTDVPYGRGGSPMQNLIARAHCGTTLTALRMCAEVDAGPVYMKEPLSLEGGGEEILIRSSHLAAHMILRIVQSEPAPVAQSGLPVLFDRRQPSESVMPELESLERAYDHIRMLDAEGYPKAYLIHRGLRYEFSRPALYDGRIIADVRITSVGYKS